MHDGHIELSQWCCRRSQGDTCVSGQTGRGVNAGNEWIIVHSDENIGRCTMNELNEGEIKSRVGYDVCNLSNGCLWIVKLDVPTSGRGAMGGSEQPCVGE